MLPLTEETKEIIFVSDFEKESDAKSHPVALFDQCCYDQEHSASEAKMVVGNIFR